jgi:hypothetical protein
MVGLIVSGAVIAECPDPVGRWVGTFQVHDGTRNDDLSLIDEDRVYEEAWAVRIMANGTWKWKLMSTEDARVSGPLGQVDDSGEGVWSVKRMTGSCMLVLTPGEDSQYGVGTSAAGPFVNKKTVKLIFQEPYGDLLGLGGWRQARCGEGTLHKVIF